MADNTTYIICADDMTGKTTFAADTMNNALDIDVTQYSDCTKRKNSIINKSNWLDFLYDNKIAPHKRNKLYKYIILPATREIRRMLDAHDENYILVYFNKDSKKVIRDRLEQRAMKQFLDMIREYCPMEYNRYNRKSSEPDFNYTEYFEKPAHYRLVSKELRKELADNPNLCHWCQMIKRKNGMSEIDEIILNWDQNHEDYAHHIDMNSCIDEIELENWEFLSNEAVIEEINTNI